MLSVSQRLTLAESAVIRSDPHFSVEHLAFNAHTQRRLELNRAGFILLKLLEVNSLSLQEILTFLLKTNLSLTRQGLQRFLEDRLDDGFVVVSDKAHRSGDDHVAGKPVSVTRPVASSPYSVEIHLTSACNLNCHHCAYDARKPRPNELSLQSWCELFDALERLRVMRVQISGGEPFSFWKFRELVQHLRTKRTHFDILTNGTLITPDLAESLASPNVALSVSLDAAEEEVHDEFRGDCCFGRTLEGLRLLAQCGAVFHLSSVVHSKNKDYLRDMVDLAVRTGATSINFVLIEPVGRAKSAPQYLLRQGDEETVAVTVRKLKEEYEQEISIGFLDPALPRYSEVQMPSLDSEDIWCAAGITRAAVRSDGKVFPCVYAFRGDPFCMGSLANGSSAKQSFEEIWLNDRWSLFRGGVTLRELHACQSCELKQICSLKVCRLKAWDATGDFYGVPPSCYSLVERRNNWPQKGGDVS